MTAKNIVLGIALILIAGSIWYLESGKVSRTPVSNNNADIPIEIAVKNTANSIATSSLVTPATPPPKPPTLSDRIKTKQDKFERVKEISTPDGFINTADTFKLADEVGKKVILVDFWTYSCINCMRTTPYLNAWYEKYKDQGFGIVGIHTPEFEFEKNYANVVDAVKREDIRYPVVLDNDYSTWTAYKNRFWPRRYLIDIDGFIVFDQIGEGGYDEMEERLQVALAERSLVLGTGQNIASGYVNPILGADKPSGEFISPETYFGSARNGLLANGTPGVAGGQTLVAQSSIGLNKLALGGEWHFDPEYAENSASGAKIVYHYSAKNVYLVASSDAGVKIKILRDGKPLTSAEAGEDVVVSNGESTATIKENRLYKLIHESSFSEHALEVIIENPGLKAFTFTFG